MSVIATRPERKPQTWPDLTLDEWAPTQTTLHRWTQMVGKTRLALAPMQNHWWQVVMYVTERGLTTSPIPFDGRTFDVKTRWLGAAAFFANLTGLGSRRSEAFTIREQAAFDFAAWARHLHSMRADSPGKKGEG